MVEENAGIGKRRSRSVRWEAMLLFACHVATASPMRRLWILLLPVGCAKTRPSGCAGSITTAEAGSSRFDGDKDGLEDRSVAHQRLLREPLRTQCTILIRLRNEGLIGDEAMHRIERDLDLEESRLEI